MDIRRGLQLTLDPQFMVDCVNQGASGSTSFLSSDNPLNPGLTGIRYDKDAGKALLDKAKQESWDGKISFLTLKPAAAIANNAAALWKSSAWTSRSRPSRSAS
ncbi:hypothetical protein [Micromonospora sp. NPDC005206]|uniref:hypothetical protein n=1 Tax=Micromonospora sp. NPDC005206 TaxID=3157022 RepID=UPI0033B245B0